MTINYADRTIHKIEDIESGIVLKYKGDFYITTNNYDYDTKKRTCVNVALGWIENIPLGIVVETYYNKRG